MPFDPTLPQPNTEIDANQMRGQLLGLKDLIDLALAGGITGVQIDGVATTDPNNPAMVSASLVGGVLHLTFTLPRGQDGVPGQPGTPGSNGGPGPTGPQGPPFATLVIDGVSTLPHGQPAFVNQSFDGTAVHLTFGIPVGADGVQGPQGDVSITQLNAAISGTSANSNNVATLDTPFADPDAESMRLRFNELVLALRRT